MAAMAIWLPDHNRLSKIVNSRSQVPSPHQVQDAFGNKVKTTLRDRRFLTDTWKSQGHRMGPAPSYAPLFDQQTGKVIAVAEIADVPVH